jgi:DNA-binding transcriptional MerR regulator
MEGPWTILELAELAAGTLAAREPTGSDDADAPAELDDAGTPAGSVHGDAPAGPDDAGTPDEPVGAGMRAGRARANGRVRDVPNERLVRWYVTVGLVDPPLSRRGRVARYGRRHLLQLVAVKRRQAEGRSLAEIQAELAGATDETLAAIARVPDAMLAPEAPTAEAPPVRAAPAPARFWTRQARQPAEPMPARERAVEPGPASAAAARGGTGAAGRPGGLVHGVRLAPGVTLLLESAGREPGPDDVTEIVRAAQPLLAELASRRLRACGPGALPDVPGPSSEVGSSPRGAPRDH